MTNVDNCPFCAQVTQGIAKDGAGGYYQLKCPTCGPFLMYNVTFRRMRNGELDGRKPAILEFIERTPPGKIAHIGQRWETRNEGPAICEVHWEYRTLAS